ncbi:MAG: ASCH domain-containing protein, partial [Nanoarchaeota archaeon]
SYERKNISLPKVGDKNIIQDSNGVERCLIITTKVITKPFSKITKAFAKKEGERDCSLSHWRKVHRKFFEKRLKRRNMKFNNNILVVCEEFKLLKIINK